MAPGGRMGPQYGKLFLNEMTKIPKNDQSQNTRREPSSMILNAELSAVHVSVPNTV
jgi:hypothetical protein